MNKFNSIKIKGLDLLNSFTARTLATILLVASLSNVANAQVSVSATAGTALGSYTTLSAAFSAIDIGTHQGAINIKITANTFEPIAPDSLHRSGLGGASYTSVTIKPEGNVTVSCVGNLNANRGLVEFAGADNITIDGDDPGTSGLRNLTIAVPFNTANSTAVVRFGSNNTLGTDGTNNITVKNLNVIGGRNVSNSTVVHLGIAFNHFVKTGILTGGYSGNNITVENCNITNCFAGIWAFGQASFPFNNVVIKNNRIGSYTASINNIGQNPLNLSYITATTAGTPAQISGNELSCGDVDTANAGILTSIGAINLNAGCQNTKIFNNNINGVINTITSGYGAYGINFTTGNNGVEIYNNMIANVVGIRYSATHVNTFVAHGIRIASTSTGLKINHNSIYLPISLKGTVANYVNYGISFVTGTTCAEFKNNIIKNDNIGSGTFAVYFVGTPFAGLTGADVNNNLYHTPGALANLGLYNGSARTSLANWKSSFTTPTPLAEANSLFGDPGFISVKDLHINTANANAVNPSNNGISIPSITTDFDGQTRPLGGATPDIGADEFIYNACVSADGGTLPPVINICANGSLAVSYNGTSSGPGTTYQWEESTNTLGPFTPIAYGTGATSTNFSAVGTPLGIPGTKYIRVSVTCPNCGPCSASSSLAQLNIIANPNVSIMASSINTVNPSVSCLGAPVNLTAVSTDVPAPSYVWAGVASTTTISVIPNKNTVYTLTATNAAGCIASSTSLVQAGFNPVLDNIVASSTAICNGGTTSLTVASNNGANPFKFTEVITNRTGAGIGVIPAYVPANATNDELIEISNLSNLPRSLANHTLEFWNSSGTVPAQTYTFLPTAVIPATSTLLVSPSAGTNNVANRLYFTGVTTAYSPLSFFMLILKSPAGIIQDVVIQGQTFTMTSQMGLDNTVWSGGNYTTNVANGIFTITPAANSAGIIRNQAIDFNDSTDWKRIDTIAGRVGSIGVYNTPYAYITLPIASQFSWADVADLQTSGNSNAEVANMANSINNSLPQGTFTVTATNSIGCTASKTITINVGGISPIVLTPTTNLISGGICEGTPLNISLSAANGGAPFIWTLSGNNIATYSVTGSSSNFISTTLLPPAGADVYTVSVSDGCSGSSTITISVMVNPAPPLVVSTASTLYCSPSTGVTNTASGASTYSWAPASTLNSATAATVIANPLITTVYTVTGTNTATGCTKTATWNVNFGQTPNTGASTPTPSICSSGAVTLIGTDTILRDPIRITEFIVNSGGTGAPAIDYPLIGSPSSTYTTLAGYSAPDMVEISNISNIAWDISGYTLFDYSASSTTTTAHPPFTFPTGTILAPKSVAVLHLGGGTTFTNVPSANFFNAGGSNDLYSSGQAAFGLILKNTANTIVDVVAGGASTVYTFAPSLGVTTQDWGGTNATIISGRGGIIRQVSTDNNNGTDWLAANITGTAAGGFWHSMGYYNDLPKPAAFSAANTPYMGGYVSPLLVNTSAYNWQPMASLATTNTVTSVTTTALPTNSVTIYTLTTTSTSGCTSMKTVAVAVGAPLTITASSSIGTICQDKSSTISVSGLGGGVPYAYSWSNGATTASQTVTPASTTTYVASVTDACGTTLTTSVVITVIPKPIINVASTPANALICNSGSVTGDISAPDPLNAYAWAPASSLNTAIGTTVISSAITSTVYTITATNSVSGCTNTGTWTVVFALTPAVSIVPSTSNICVGDTVTMTASDTILKEPIKFTEAVLFSGSTAGPIIDYPLIGSPAGTYTTWAATTNLDLLEISNTSNVTWDISGYSLFIYNASNTTTTSHPVFTFPSGTILPGKSVAVINMGTGTNVPAARFFNTGGTNGLYFTPPTNFAAILRNQGGLIADIIVSSTTAYTFAPSLGVTVADWSGSAPMGAGSSGGAIRIVPTDNNLSTDWKESGVAGTPIGGFFHSLGYYNETPKPAAMATTSLPYLGGYVSPLSVNTSSFLWGGTALFTSMSANPVKANPTTTSIYTVTATTPAGCTNSKTITISAGAPLVCNALSVAPLSGPFCTNTTFTITATTAGGGSTKTFSLSNGVQAPIVNNSGIFNLNGSSSTGGVYTITTTDNCNNTCSQTIAITVNTITPVAIAATPTTNVVCQGAPVTLVASGSSSYTWTPNTLLSATSGATVISNATSTLTYTVLGTDANGCTATATSVVVAQSFGTKITPNAPKICPGSSVSLAASDTFGFVVNTVAPSACNSAFSSGSGSGDFLDSVSLVGVFNNKTGANPAPFYATYNFLSPALSTGVTYTIWGRTGSFGSSNGLMAWVDKDLNGTFDPSEKIGEVNALGSFASTSFTFSLSPIGPFGQMRIRFMEVYSNTGILPCTGYSFGETEDYIVYVAPPTVAGNTYSWSNATGVVGTGSPLVVSPTVSTIYTVTSSTAQGCTATRTVNVTLDVPTISVTGPVAIAPSGTGTLSASGATSYTWTPASDISGINIGPNVIAAPVALSGSITYTVTGSSPTGCTSTATKSVIIAAPILAQSATPPSSNPTCNGLTNGTIAYSFSGGSSVFTVTINGTTVGASPVSGYGVGTYTVIATDAIGVTSSTVVTLTQPGVLAMAPNVKNIKCNGQATGSIKLNVTGGTVPYTYTWSNGASTDSIGALVANAYSVSVIDANGCTAITNNFTITEPSTALLAVANVNASVSCFGGNNGAASIVASGGTSPYTYFWNTGATAATLTNLIANGYTITTSDANACTATTSLTIVQPLNALAASTGNILSPTCVGGNDGAIEAFATGGTPPYTYLWSDGNTNAANTTAIAGNYTVTVKDNNNCTKTATGTIVAPTAITINTFVVNNVKCNGGITGKAYVTYSGGNSSSYIVFWSTGTSTSDTLDNIGAGTYTVDVYDANFCSKTAVVTITEPTGVTISATVASDVTCAGLSNGVANTSVNGGTAPYTYLWSPGGATTASLIGAAAGNYTCVVTDANSCTTESDVSILEPGLLGIAATITAQVSCNGGANGALMGNATGGTLPYNYSWSNGVSTAANTGLMANSYTLTVTDANNCTATASNTITQPTVLTLTLGTLTNVTCHGLSNGAVVVTPAGGTSGYTVTPTQTGLAAGTYTFVVTDANSCSTTVTAMVTQPMALVASATAPAILCFGGTTTITVSASAGTSPYASGTGTFSVIAGSYTYTVTDANSCLATTSITIAPAPSAVTITPTVTNAVCFGGTGSVSFVTSGGTGSITVSPSTNSGLVAGNYTYTATDANNCTTSTVITIMQPTQIVLSVTPINASCAGTTGGIMTSATGGTGTIVITINGAAPASSYLAGTYTVSAQDAAGCIVTSTTQVLNVPTITISGSATAPLCNGGTGSVSYMTAGGAVPITVTYGTTTLTASPTTGIAVGAYTLVAKDANNCTSTVIVTVGAAPSAIVVNTVNKSPVLCYNASNGAAQILASGGTGALTYSITPSATQSGNSFSGMAAGNYTVNVKDANNCSITTVVSILQPSVLTFVPDVVYAPSYCLGNDGKLSVWANGGTGTKTYALNPTGAQSPLGTFNSLMAGSYTVTATDINGCSTTESVVITNTPAITLTSATAVAPVCAGNTNGSLNVVAAGGTPALVYSIAPSATQTTPGSFVSLASGSYVVTVKDGRNCTITTSVTVSSPAAIVFNPIVSTSPTCNGGTNGMFVATATGGAGTLTYTKSNASGMQTSAGTFVNCASGIYVVTAKDANNCSKTIAFPLNQPAAIAFNNTTKTSPSCFGLSTGVISSASTGGVGPRVFSVMPIAGTSPSSPVAIGAVGSISALPSNTYTLTVKDANNCIKTTTVVLNQPSPLVFSTVVAANPVAAGSGQIVVSATGGTGTKSYTLAPAGTVTAPGTFGGLNVGTYVATATDANSCSITTSVTLTQAVLTVENGVVTIKEENANGNAMEGLGIKFTKFDVYPNPTNGPLQIEVVSDKDINATITISDLSGKRVRTIETFVTKGSNNLKLDLGDLVNGIYTLQMTTDSKDKYNKVIEKR